MAIQADFSDQRLIPGMGLCRDGGVGRCVRDPLASLSEPVKAASARTAPAQSLTRL